MRVVEETPGSVVVGGVVVGMVSLVGRMRQSVVVVVAQVTTHVWVAWVTGRGVVESFGEEAVLVTVVAGSWRRDVPLGRDIPETEGLSQIG